MKKTPLTLLVYVLCALSIVEARQWTNKAGKKIEAEFVELKGSTLVLQLSTGKKVNIPLSTLAPSDVAFAKAEASKVPEPVIDAAAAGKALDLEKVAPWDPTRPRDASSLEAANYGAAWPTSIKGQSKNSSIVKEDDEARIYIYDSLYFRFECNAPLRASVINKFSVLFDGAYLANKALPLANTPTRIKNIKFPIRLVETRAQYAAEGGPPGSAGVHMLEVGKTGAFGVVMVPFESLGIQKAGKDTYRLDYTKQSSVLVHEVTHQLMSYSAKKLPWLCEGSAEYVTYSCSKIGTFDFKGNKDNIIAAVTEYGKDKKGGRALGKSIDLPSLEAFMSQDYETFLTDPQRNYGFACLLVYYWYHMDGAGDAARIKKYFEAVQERGEDAPKAMEKYLLDGRTWDQLSGEVAKAWSKSRIDLKFGKGSIATPSTGSGEES